MHLSKNKKILEVVLVILIIAVNCVTVFTVVRYCNFKNTYNIFDSPDSITIGDGDGNVTIYPDDEKFNVIVDLNSKRREATEYLVEFNTSSTDLSDTTYITYNYSKERTVLVDLLTEQGYYRTQKISFILTGEQSSQVLISTQDGTVTLGMLISNHELTELVKDLSNDI